MKIDKFCSVFETFNGGVPQGSWFGPFLFLVLINDLKTMVDLFKFIDDTTMLDTMPKPGMALTHVSNARMQLACNNLHDWSVSNNMNINIKKSCDMIFSLCDRNVMNVIDNVTVGDLTISRVTSYKLLGVIVQDNLKWSLHVNYICKCASKKLYLLKRLRRFDLCNSDLLHFYLTVIRPTLEYACPLWHYGLTKSDSDAIEHVQRRAMRIIFGTTSSYNDILQNFRILSTRRESLCINLFNSVLSSDNCLHHLLPPRRTINNNFCITRSSHNNHNHNHNNNLVLTQLVSVIPLFCTTY